MTERERDLLDEEEPRIVQRIRDLADGLIARHAAAFAERRADSTASGVLVARH